jgi:aerobic-type carbon monoxide dehydrogenase small subunit (CoxS/CutS family)
MALAGGQTMIGLLNQRRVRPARVVDLTGIAELTTVRREGAGVVAGAMVTLEQAARDPLLVAAAPLLAEATACVASPQIRARSTLGGSVAHADPVGEALTALVALRAQAVVAAPGGERTAAVQDLVLAPGELVVTLRIPDQEAGGAFAEVAPRFNARALVGAAAVGDRLVVSGVAARPAVVVPEGIAALIAWDDPRADAVYRKAAATALAARVLARARSSRATAGGGAPGPTLPAAPSRLDGAPVACTVNGEPVRVDAEPRLLLSDLLRHRLGLTASHVGCEHGVCGACNVLVDGVAVRSCLMLAVQAHGREIVTPEGLDDAAVTDALVDRHALQCGFCTPGIRITLAEGGTDLSGNICRCTGYAPIVAAARTAR